MTLPTDLSATIKERIETTIPKAQVQVMQGGNGHFSLTVVSEVFSGMTLIKQHQLVYSAITDLMSGPNAPVHAIDKMDLRTS